MSLLSRRFRLLLLLPEQTIDGGIREEGVSVVIASGMGSRAQALFRQNCIEVIINVVESDPEKAVLDYIGGRLEVGDDVCDH